MSSFIGLGLEFSKAIVEENDKKNFVSHVFKMLLSFAPFV